MICKRIFYFLLYISFIYRSTFVLSNSTTAVPVETDSSQVDPNASHVVPGAGAPLVTSVATTINQNPADGISTSTIVDTSSALAGAQVASSVTHSAPVAHSFTVPTAQDPNAGVASHTHVASGVQPMGAPLAGTPLAMTTPIAGTSVAMGTPTPGAQVASPVTNATQHVAAPVSHGAQVVNHVDPGTQAMAAPMMPGYHVVTTPASTGAPIAGSPVSHGSQGVTPVTHGAQVASSVTHSAPVAHSFTVPTAQDPNAGVASHTHVASGVQPMGAPLAGTPLAMTTPIAETSVAMGTPTPGAQVASPVTNATQHVAAPVTHGAQVVNHVDPGTQAMAAPMMPGYHVVTTPATPGAPIATISLDGNPSTVSMNPPNNLISIEITNKKDTAYIKYRRIDSEGMDIFYAKEGYLINEILLSGKKRWPPDGEVKECKKVLFIINPTDGKKTLRVLYPDEADAYDPDNPPVTTSNSDQDMTQPSLDGFSTPLSTESTASYNEADEASLSLPLSSGSGSTAAIPSLEDVLSATDPNAITSVPHQDSYRTDKNGNVYLEFTVAKGQDSSDLASGSHSTNAFTVEEIHAPRQGRTIEYEDSDDEFTPGDDDDSPVDLTTYVTRVGRRVGHLENRMDSAETTIRLLTRTVEYQHEILDFRRRFGVKTAPFGADMGRHAFFDPAAFRPATSQVSKVLDATEHPSDIKLFVLDANDDSKHVELGKDKFTVKQEGDEIQYVFESGVECKLVTFKDRTVWNHRTSDPHPMGVVFHPDDDKVVVDFEDAIVMYVKKGEIDGEDVGSGHPVKKSIVDIALGNMETDEEEPGKPKASESENGTDVTADTASNDGDKGIVAEAVPSVVSNDSHVTTNHVAESSNNSTVTVPETPDQTATVPEPPAQTATVTEPPAQTATVTEPPVQTATVPESPAQTASVPAEAAHSSPLPETQPAHGATMNPAPLTMAQPVTYTSAQSAVQQEVHTPPVTPVASRTAAPISVAMPANGATATPLSQTLAQPAYDASAIPAGAAEASPVPAGLPVDSSGTSQTSEHVSNEGAPTV